MFAKYTDIKVLKVDSKSPLIFQRAFLVSELLDILNYKSVDVGNSHRSAFDASFVSLLCKTMSAGLLSPSP